MTAKKGTLRTCPSCGATWVSGAVVCKECGYSLTDAEANSSAILLDKRLSKALNSEKAQIISSFPIPHTREDLIEFLAALEPKANKVSTDDNQRKINSAYTEKFNECLNKAKMLFPNDPTIARFVSGADRKKKLRLGIIVAIVLVVIAVIVAIIISNQNDSAERDRVAKEWVEQVEAYNAELCAEIDALPTPDASNYKECIRQFSSITWEKNLEWDYNKWGNGSAPINDEKEAYAKKKAAYASMIGSAMKEAGVEDIPLEFSSPHEMHYSL